MLRGLVTDTEDGPQVSNTYTATDTALAGGNSEGAVTATAGGPSTETAASVTSTSGGQQAVVGEVNSHLDSFFATSALTREDVLVVAAVVQMLAWAMLLYLEVNE